MNITTLIWLFRCFGLSPAIRPVGNNKSSSITSYLLILLSGISISCGTAVFTYFFIIHEGIPFISLASVVASLLISTLILTQLAIALISFRHRYDQLDILQLFQRIDNALDGDNISNSSSMRLSRPHTCQLLCTVAIIMLSYLPYFINFIPLFPIIFSYFLCSLLATRLCIMLITMFVNLLQHRIDRVNHKLATIIEMRSATVRHDCCYNQVEVLKFICGDLTLASHLISGCFGSSILIITIEHLLQIVTIIYVTYLLLTEENPETDEMETFDVLYPILVLQPTIIAHAILCYACEMATNTVRLRVGVIFIINMK